MSTPSPDPRPCRSTALRAQTLALVVPAKLEPPLRKQLDGARDRLEQARTACAAARKRPPRTALRRLARHVARVARRLRKLPDDAAIPASAAAIASAGAIRSDAVALRRALRCPDAAAAPLAAPAN